MCRGVIGVFVVTGLVCGSVLHGQAPPPQDVTIDQAARREAIDAALAVLSEAYVFPDVAEKMASAIRARQARGEYDAITSGREFARVLTAHLREVSNDAHLGIDMQAQGPPPPPMPGGVAQTIEERQRAMFGRQNFGFQRLERLVGNIGYLDLRGFVPPPIAGETATAAMTFLSASDAVIIDLRQNGGGDPAMVAFLTSYLVGPRAIHLNDFYSRTNNETRQSWTLPYVPGRRLTDIDLYLLTGPRTFSGAEEFSYNLKALKRATIVGEATGGGAHTVFGRRLTGQFVMAVPSGRPINPVTGTNWEGVGVQPDVKVSADNALRAAHVLALESGLRRLTSDMPGIRNEMTTTIAALRKELGSEAASLAKSDDDIKAVPASEANEDFESGSLARWRVEAQGAGKWDVYRRGRTSRDPAGTDASNPFEVPEPPQGQSAAVTLMNGPGRFLLYRDVTLDGRYRLRATVFYVNYGRFSAATVSPRNRINEEQQFRIDILAAQSPADSMIADHVLATLFESKPGDPPRRGPFEVAADLSRWEGQTIRLRLAVGQNQAALNAGVDEIRFERIQP